MSSPIFSGPNAFHDALAHGVKASAEIAKEEAARRRAPDLAPTAKIYEVRGEGAVAAWHDALAAQALPANEQQRDQPADDPDPDPGKVHPNWQSAMRDGALDMPAWSPPASGPEEIAQRYAAFAKDYDPTEAGLE